MPEPLLDQDTMKRLEQLAIVSRKLSTGRLRGERRSRRRGSSTDFADYRNYVAGDDLRFLDWKIYSRLEHLFIKLFQEEEDLRVYILIDASPSMCFGDPEKLLYARRVAAALGYICLAKMDRLVAATFGNGLSQSYGPKRGKRNSAGYLDFLSTFRTAEGTGLLETFKTFAQANTRGIVFILSDFYDFGGYEDALRQLFAGSFEVAAIHILSPQELAPEHQGDIRLTDCEQNLTTDISMGPATLDIYARTLKAFSQGLKDYVIGRGGYYLLTSTRTPFDRLVLDVLRRQGMIR